MESVLKFLVHDHARCNSLIDALIGFVGDADWAIATTAATMLSTALQRHIRIEEELVFVPLDAMLDVGLVPTAGMRAEHERMVGIAGQLSGAVAQRDASRACACARMLKVILQIHFDKEHSGFFLLADQVLAPRNARMAAALAAIQNEDMA